MNLFDGRLNVNSPQPEAADDGLAAPKVTGSPEAIWLNYGDIEYDDTHREMCSHGEVTWCEDGVFDSDVRYTRSDLVDELVRAAIAADRAASEAPEELPKVPREMVFRHFGVDAGHPLLRTVWKDSIDIEAPTYALQCFAEAYARFVFSKKGT